MSNDDASHDSTAPVRRQRTWPWYGAAGVLVLIAWLIAQYPPVPKASSPDDVSASFVFLVGGAFPWLLQWAGVSCAAFGIFGSRIPRRALLFAIFIALTPGIIWWSGLAYTYWRMDLLEMIIEIYVAETQSQMGGTPIFRFLVFDFVGPLVGLFQLCGPTSLRGWQFLSSLLSTTLTVGYFLVVARWCRIEDRPSSFYDQAKFVVKFTTAMLPCFLPSFIRLSI